MAPTKTTRLSFLNCLFVSLLYEWVLIPLWLHVVMAPTKIITSFFYRRFEKRIYIPLPANEVNHYSVYSFSMFQMSQIFVSVAPGKEESVEEAHIKATKLSHRRTDQQTSKVESGRKWYMYYTMLAIK